MKLCSRLRFYIANYVFFASILIVFLTLTSSQQIGEEEHFEEKTSSKLLIILLDGFRWDYYQRQKTQLPGLNQLVSQGVHVKWVEPIFPSLSFPSWTTIATGLYPENHNILGNYMLHLADADLPETVFQLKDNSTELPFWWQSAEPIWTTATKHNKKVYLANWARCDVPYDGILPEECSGYTYQNINSGFRDDLNTAIKRLKSGFSLAMVYDDFIDHVGHQFGPDSSELKLAMIQRDSNIQELLLNLQLGGLYNKINVVLVSDHGMTNVKQNVIKYIQLSDYIDDEDVYKVVDYGAVVSIVAAADRSHLLHEKLGEIPGMNVYAKADIPEEFHFKGSKLALDFLLVAKPGYAIVGLKGEKQIPQDNKSSSIQPYAGSHGYFNMTDMRTIFYARGPAFKKGLVHPSIRLEDEYQIFMDILGIPALPNNGTWTNVNDMLA